MAELKIGDVVDVLARDEALSVPVSPARWFVLRVHPQAERRVQDRLTARGACCYAPAFPKQVLVARQHAWQKPIRQRRVVPLFPGLVFVPEFDADLRRLQRLSDGIAGYLSFNGVCASLSPKLMDEVRGIEADLSTPLAQKRRRMSGLTVGSRVRFREGSAFAMWTGRIERLDDAGRLRVLIDIVQREIAVEVTAHQVEPVEQATAC